jgi:hypothetical protein
MALPQLTLGDGRMLPITDALAHELAAAAITSPTHAAQVVDAELSPALLLIAGGDLAYVTRSGTQLWSLAELKRIEGKDIIPLAGPAVTIGDWGATSERADFLRATAALILASAIETAPAPPVLADAAGEIASNPVAHRCRAGVLALVAGGLSAVVGGLGLASASALLFNDPGHGRMLRIFVAATAVLGLPLLIAGFKLARRDSPWRDLGVFGAAIAAATTSALAPGLVALTYFAPTWHV